MGILILRVTCVLVSFVALACHVVSFATDYWIQLKSGHHFGMWDFARGAATDGLKAFSILGGLFGLVAVVMLLVYVSCRRRVPLGLVQISFSAAGTAAICSVVCVSVGTTLVWADSLPSISSVNSTATLSPAISPTTATTRPTASPTATPAAPLFALSWSYALVAIGFFLFAIQTLLTGLLYRLELPKIPKSR